MLLAADVGNTRTVYGVVDGGKVTATFDCVTEPLRTADEHLVFLTSVLAARGFDPASINGAVMASVVPRCDEAMLAALETVCGCETIVVGPGVKTGVSIRYDKPRDVGADRIANVVGARRKAGEKALVVIDFGTATTFDVIDQEGTYLGGIILPGMGVAADAIVRRTALLTRFRIARPPSVVGRNTVHALQSGIYFGTVAQVEGMTARIRKEPGFSEATLIATGGYASLIAQDCPSVERVEPDLTLEGLIEIYELNQP